MSINTNVIKAGTYSVEIVFTLDEDTRETELDRMFEDAMYLNFNDISDSNIGEYINIDDIADKLQAHILTLDNDAIEEFCGFSLDCISKEDAVYQVITQMPDDVLLEYCNKYFKN